MSSLLTLLITLLFALPLTSSSPLIIPRATNPSSLPHNGDFSCKSSAHPNPIVLLHGLGATYYEDINELQSYLNGLSFCTFAVTYGASPEFPYVGGLRPVNESAVDVANFITLVQQQTGAAKVDIVGHSEGAFQSLYVPKFEGISHIVDKIVAIAPPTHGTTFGGLYDLAFVGGNLTRDLVDEVIATVGCQACDDLVIGGAAVERLNDGKPIVQPGNTATIIASRYDELVTPTYTAFVNETGVGNLYIQDYCPDDPVGHIGEAYDTNTWNLVFNALVPSQAKSFACSYGSPGR